MPSLNYINTNRMQFNIWKELDLTQTSWEEGVSGKILNSTYLNCAPSTYKMTSRQVIKTI